MIDFTESYNCFTESCSCTSLLTSVTSGTGVYTASTTASCGLTLDGPYSYTETYTWNTGQSSTVTYTTGETVRAVNGTTTVTSIGTVTAGLGAGCVVRGGGKADSRTRVSACVSRPTPGSFPESPSRPGSRALPRAERCAGGGHLRHEGAAGQGRRRRLSR